MACEVVKAEFAGQPATFFVCGPKAARKRCAFCKRTAAALCDWPAIKHVKKPMEEAKIGDVWITEGLKKRAAITAIEDHRARDGRLLGRIFDVLIPGYKTPFAYTRHAGQEFPTEELGTCDKPCCFAHRRQVGPERDYCMDHWKEQVQS